MVLSIEADKLLTKEESFGKEKNRGTFLLCATLVFAILAAFFFGLWLFTITKQTRTTYTEISKLRMELPPDLQKVEEGVFTKFDELNANNGITFVSLDDIIKHFKVLVKNVERAKIYRARNSNIVYGFNKYMLMTDDELRADFMPVETLTSLSPLKNVEFMRSNGVRPMNASHDWREDGVITPVKNQGNSTNSLAFAITSTVEAFHAIKNKQYVNLAEQELIDCVDTYNNTSNVIHNSLDYVTNFGLALEHVYLFSGTRGQCQNITESKISVPGWTALPSDEAYLADWVANNGPVVVGVLVTREMLQYEEGVLSVSYNDCYYRSIGAQFMTIVGYGKEAGDRYWIVKNSWGTGFGENGYMKIERGRNTCGIAQWAFAPSIS
uniref:Pept_C1 domain-containing protein n=1 Tax=Panagrellus redivivus TaxID=6233 RepID=A0A7E4ZTN4_PANRE